MALAADRPVPRRGLPVSTPAGHFTLVADEVYYNGAIISIHGSEARVPSVDNAGDYCVICMRQLNPGDPNEPYPDRLKAEYAGVFLLPFVTPGGLVAANRDALVYAFDDEFFTLTAGVSTTILGRIVELDEDNPADAAWVYVFGPERSAL